jgi:hypothetical protein
VGIVYQEGEKEKELTAEYAGSAEKGKENIAGPSTAPQLASGLSSG